MRKHTIYTFFTAISLLLFITITGNLIVNAQSSVLERKIVIFKDTYTSKASKDSIIQSCKAIKIKDLNIVNGCSIFISKENRKNLEQQPEILRIDDDIIVSASGKVIPPTPGPQPPQVLPWSIDAIDAEQVFSNIISDPIKVGIIDTGIDLLHPDLKDNIKGGYNAINSKYSFTDDNGHGTHVAGVIAALNNSIGVVGVAPKTDIYAIKALDSQAAGYTSDIIESIDWAIRNKMKVLNMSFNIPNDVQSLHDAVIRANQAGIIQVASAGNDCGGPVTYPAAYKEVISVSSIDASNNISYFSSIGKIDLCAPGTDIFSTCKGSSYLTMSGTSMSAPHVVGVISLLLHKPSICDSNIDGVCSPTEVLKRLEDSSIDLGSTGKDSFYGAGLVNAYSALYKDI